MSTETTEKATCRGCGKILKGKPYYMGGAAYDPKTNEQCKVNHYGGYVCSEECDRRASLELERSMPGHGGGQRTIGQSAQQSLNRNWHS